MSDRDRRADERAFYDDTDYAELELEPADDVKVVHGPAPRSTFALRLDANTIEELREVARQHGTRPTQIAREWLIERLEREQQRIGKTSERQADVDRLEERFSALERRLNYFISGSYERGTRLTALHDSDVLAGLDAQALFARELLVRLSDAVSVEVPSDPGADLLVRGGDRSWVVQFKGATADVAPSFKHIVNVAKRLKAHPVLVSPQATRVEVEAMATSSGVLVMSLDDIDSLVDEISARIADRAVPGDADSATSDATTTEPQQSRRRRAATGKP